MGPFNYAQCNRENLAPRSNDAVWSCINMVIEHVNRLDRTFVAITRGDKAVVFRSHENGRNLITIWPRIDTLAINLKGSGRESQNRIDNSKVFTPDEFEKTFQTIQNGIYEVFVG